MDWTQFLDLKAALLREITPEYDSLRIYNLGNRYREKVEHFGAKTTPDLKEDTLLF